MSTTKFANHISVRAIIKADDDREQVTELVHSLFPFDLKKEKIGPKDTEKKVFQLDLPPIEVYEIELEKHRHIRAFLDSFFDVLSKEDIQLLYDQRETRIDEECDFFIRLDMHDLVEGGIFTIVEHGHCIHIRLSIAAYPARRDVGLNVATEMLEFYLEKKSS